ncbi:MULTISPECIES: hypothetical protein [unclassified Helicobacter]|uniref:hypothetical protein n=1 Tax=unclassified Helicobacter TaxID=2593540 RepID=UPI0012E837FE|nr:MULTISPECIES: hypothetical protein [unclassified Helicobacter]
MNEIYNAGNFDVKKLAPNAPAINYAKLDSAYNLNADALKSGDIIILSNASANHIDEEYINQMKQKYRLIYKTERIGLPYISIKSLAKEFIYRRANLEKKDSDTDTKSLKDALFFVDKNYFRLPINNYVFLVE